MAGTETPGKGAEAPATAGQGGDLAAILAALGLAPEAKAADAVQAIAALNSQLKDLQAKQADAQAESDLSEFGDSIANRAEVKKQLIANREGTLATLRSLKKGEPGKQTLINRANNKLPSGNGEDQADAKENARCAKIKNRAAEIAKTQHVNFQTAWNLAEAENPKEG